MSSRDAMSPRNAMNPQRTVVMLHGLGETATAWAPVLDQCPNVRALTPELTENASASDWSVHNERR